LKTLKQGPDGFLYLNVGSSCNVCAEPDPLRATILRYTVDGKPAGGFEPGLGMPAPVWAAGLRNSEGFAWHPQTRAMYATNNGADMRSDKKGGSPVDDLPPEHLNRIEPGAHYGWPYCWGDQHADPNFVSAEGFCAGTSAPAMMLPAHAAPLGMTFLNTAAFPTEYRDDAIIALHGSWNRTQPSGYKLVRVKFNQDKPVELIDFATGWLNDTEDKKGAWGRPVDVVVGPDGVLYVSDDRAGIVYNISYGKKIAP
jgi:glucose/arabinose dehydrogenase